MYMRKKGNGRDGEHGAFGPERSRRCDVTAQGVRPQRECAYVVRCLSAPESSRGTITSLQAPPVGT
jgi:hypothetical protein